MLTTGAVIGGKFEILTVLGEGGMSVVYLAMDKRLNKQWAVKEVKQTGDRVNDAIVAQSFVKEANVMKRLDHPMLPRIVDIINHEDTLYVVMDYIEGRSLDQILKEDGPQPQEFVVEWGKQLADALDYLHTRTPAVIYRDMKPSNVMLKPDGTVRIIDFGIAREYKEPDANKRIDDTTMLGTRGYAAPEQFGGIGQTDPRTDIYCLGATMYHLLTGNSPAEPPYEMYPIRQVDPSLSPGLEKVVATCTQQNPDLRYQTCAELFYALENYETADDEHFRRQRTKMRLFIAACILTGVFLVGGGASLIANHLFINSGYDATLARAAAAADPTLTANYYLEAIDIIPSDPRAYLGLIALYKQDNRFTPSEESQFSAAVLTNFDSIKANRDPYSSLAYEIGKLYWYYYSYGSDAGNNQHTRIVAAQSWFVDASLDKAFSNQRAAQVYADIASFDADITSRINEGSDAQSFGPYYQNLVELNELAQTEQNDVVSLEVCRLTLTSIETYARKFAADAVTRQQLDDLYNNANNLLRNVHPTSVELDDTKRQISERVLEARAALDDALKGGEGL
ncbi:MAG: serine/threonine protein kinase [Coriobacteriales bacterium]|nr:serine/threonine protein kinase [Coriobacteriales bacterium]